MRIDYKEAKRNLYRKILKFSKFKLIYQEYYFAFSGDKCCLGNDINEDTKRFLYKDIINKIGEGKLFHITCSECPSDSLCSILSSEFKEMEKTN